METIAIPGEAEIRHWVKEALKEYFTEVKAGRQVLNNTYEPFVSRATIAKFLDISLVTLHEMVKDGMPAYKKTGKVYFIQSEVVEYMKRKH